MLFAYERSNLRIFKWRISGDNFIMLEICYGIDGITLNEILKTIAIPLLEKNL
jgi:hypothetical protein